MSKYIALDGAIHILAENYDKYDPQYTSGEYIRKGLFLAKELIRLMPAADVAEVVHGKWNNQTRGQFCKNGIFRTCRFYQCGKCKYKSIVKTNFCPNCGAKMDGGRKES